MAGFRQRFGGDPQGIFTQNMGKDLVFRLEGGTVWQDSLAPAKLRHGGGGDYPKAAPFDGAIGMCNIGCRAAFG